MFIGYTPLGEIRYFLVQTRNSAGEPLDADSLPTFRVYAPNSETLKAAGTMAAFDTTNTDGVYSGSFTASGGAGFASGNCYWIIILAVVNGVEQVIERTFIVT